MRHTPGPWQGLLRISGPNGRIVAQVQTLERNIPGSSNTLGAPAAEAEANARLIAAAPDLLETIERIELLVSNEIEGRPPTAMERYILDATHIAIIQAKDVVISPENYNYGRRVEAHIAKSTRR